MSDAIRQARALFPGAEKRIYMDVSVRGLLARPVREAAERQIPFRVFLGDDLQAGEFTGVGDICHIVPGSFQLGDRNMLMFPYAPRPLLSGHGGPKDRNSHRQYERYYLEAYRAQYGQVKELLEAEQILRNNLDKGGLPDPKEITSPTTQP